MVVDHTEHYGLLILPDGDLSPEGYAALGRDRVLLDQLVWLGAEGHRHTGEPSDINSPAVGLDLTLDVTTGSLPPSTRFYYRHTYVDPNNVETTPSDEVWIDTPGQVSAPGAATVAFADTGGTLPPGSYGYALSAYKDFNDLETPAGPSAAIQLPYAGATSTNVITITLPALPAGADGYNVYRKAPGDIGYRYLTSIAGTPATFDDDGSLTTNSARRPATVNTTQSTNAVDVALGEALPAGYLWRLYRTTDLDDWTSSLLATIGPTVDTYTDTGGATTVGSPPEVGSAPGSPAKVILTDGLEVQGELPLTMVEGLLEYLGAKLDRSAVDQPGGVPVLDDDGRTALAAMPGPVLAAVARRYQ